jgi:hypothetical protein
VFQNLEFEASFVIITSKKSSRYRTRTLGNPSSNSRKMLVINSLTCKIQIRELRSNCWENYYSLEPKWAQNQTPGPVGLTDSRRSDRTRDYSRDLRQSWILKGPGSTERYLPKEVTLPEDPGPWIISILSQMRSRTLKNPKRRPLIPRDSGRKLREINSLEGLWIPGNPRSHERHKCISGF